MSMKIEEAIEKTEEAFGYSTSIHDDWKPHQEACDIAIQALEKQIAKKPIPGSSYLHKCPTCNFRLTIYIENYCDECGQKLDWEETYE